MSNYSAVNTGWVLVAAILIFLMQAGFAMLESGFTRSKNAGSMAMDNMIDFCISSPIFIIWGFGLMFGKGPVIGSPDFFVSGDYSQYLTTGIPLAAYVFFEACFCGTSATIVSGALAERTKFSAYCLCSALMSAIVYPLVGHWIWGHGWLSALGFHDFAGGTLVHVVGGMAALAGIMVLGPRVGKYSREGKSRAIPGHSMTAAALGMFLLWFGWFGFNAGSTLGIDTPELGSRAARVLINTNLSAAMSALSAMFFTWIRYKKPDITYTINGAVTGLVAATAGCDVLAPESACLVGILAGIVMVIVNTTLDRKLHLDDPVGAIGVHAGGGFVGTISVGFFSEETGLFYGHGAAQLGLQLLGVLAAGLTSWCLMTVIFHIVNKTVGLRVPVSTEIAGLDKIEHGFEVSYEGFMTSNYMPDKDAVYRDNDAVRRKAQLATSVHPEESDTPISKVEIIMKESKFDELKHELNKIGITGITVSQVMGCGEQKGQLDYYRGNAVEMQLLPKIRVEIVVAKVPVKDVVDTAKRVLYTGHIGDGKIFVYHVGNAIKVRTGEEGYDAMQNDD